MKFRHCVLLSLHSLTLMAIRVPGFMRFLLVPDTSIKEELYLFVQGSVFAFGESS
jgi:hypothetical protein